MSSSANRSVLQYHGLEKYLPPLKGYMHLAELNDLHEGAYLRWIHLDRRTLTNGAFLVNVQLVPAGIFLTLKNSRGRFFSIWSDDVILFQKITETDRLRHVMEQFNTDNSPS